MRQRTVATKKRLEAARRGQLPEEIADAEGELEVARVKAGSSGTFAGLGVFGQNGGLREVTVVTAFGPKRLFDPESTARVDTRTLDVLCAITTPEVPVFSGQRVVVQFALPDLAEAVRR